MTKQSILSATIDIIFDGNCREAMEYYKKIFNIGEMQMLTAGELPQDIDNPVPDSDKDKIAHGSMKISDMEIHFFDNLSNIPIITGNNIMMHIWIEGKDETTKIFNQLKKDGVVHDDLKEQFYADLNGVVTDKFGVKWNLLCHVPRD